MGARRSRELDAAEGCRATDWSGWRSREHYASLPAAVREQIDLRIEQLLENLRRQPRSAYDEATDQWTTTYGSGAGLIVYVVVHERGTGRAWCRGSSRASPACATRTR